MVAFKVVGTSVPRLDAPDKVTGRAKYTTDIVLPGMCHGVLVRSPLPHALIRGIDTSRAQQLAGVRAVVTAKDIPGKAPRHFFARDIARFIGDPVAAVAAQTPDLAAEAASLVEVDYEELPALFDPEAALQPHPAVVLGDPTRTQEAAKAADRPRVAALWSYQPKGEADRPNIHSHFKIRTGDVERGFQEADLTLESRFTTARIQHCQFEPHIAVAQWEAAGLTVWCSAQGIYGIKYLLCDAFGLGESQVRLIEPYVGGGYGGKIGTTVAFYAALLSYRSGKPVRVAFSREEVFTCTTCRAPFILEIKDGVKKDGTMVAREVRAILNGGAYAESIERVVRNCSYAMVGTYRLPNLKYDSYGVYTNEPVSGAFRGFGSPEILWGIESHMDMVAEKLGMDPVAFRKRNFLREGERNAVGEVTHSIGVETCLDMAARWIGWGQPSRPPQGPWRYGKGIAAGNKYTSAPNSSVAIVKVHQDGVVEVRHSADEMGQGCNTALAQIAAEEFGISVDQVRMVRGDTAYTPYDPGSSSSKTTYTTGNAVRLACADAKGQIFEKAANLLEARPEDLETAQGRIFVRGSPERGITVRQLFAGGRYLLEGGELLGKATFVQPYTPEDPETGHGERLVSYYTHGAQGVEVAVNVETGEVRAVRFVSAFDMGQPINPKLCEAQMEGGMGKGVGSALYEALVVEEGRTINPTFMDYKLPTTAELPSGEQMRCFFAPVPHRDGPFGAKGLGEAVMTPSAPAIANAIYNAVGVRIKELPITREKILAALRQKERAAQPGEG